MNIGLFMFAPMRQIGAEVEELKETQERRDDVEGHHIGLRDPKCGHIKQDRHHKNLVPPHIVDDESEKPAEKGRWTIIGILLGCRMSVVRMVCRQQT